MSQRPDWRKNCSCKCSSHGKDKCALPAHGTGAYNSIVFVTRALSLTVHDNRHNTAHVCMNNIFLVSSCRKIEPHISLPPTHHIHTFPIACCAARAMRFSLPLLSALLLPLLRAASSTPTPTPSPAHPARAAITSPPSATAPPSRRGDNFDPSIAPISLNLPSISIAKPSIPSLSLDLPPETCTPGFISYATPGLDGYVPADACNALWVYFPNFAAAVAFSNLFGILTIAQLAQAVLYRNGFCWVIIMAALWETGAYAFRALGSKNQQSSGIATVAQILVLVAPICECQAERQLSLPFLISSFQGSTPSHTWSSPAWSTSTRPLARYGSSRLPASLSSSLPSTLFPSSFSSSAVEWPVQAQVRNYRKRA